MRGAEVKHMHLVAIDFGPRQEEHRLSSRAPPRRPQRTATAQRRSPWRHRVSSAA